MIEVSQNNFGEVVLDSTIPVLVDFFSENCGPCRLLKPVLKALAESLGDTAKIVTVDVAANEALAHASGDWILWLDAGERLDARNQTRLRALLTSLGDEPAAYVMPCLCDPGGEPTVIDHVRLFRKLPGVRWENRIHEQILPSLRRSGVAIKRCDVTIRRLGQTDCERDLRLLRMDLADRPDDPAVLFHLGAISQEAGRLDEAFALYERSLAGRASPAALARMADIRFRQGQLDEALALCLRGTSSFPDDAELLLLEGTLRAETGDLLGAQSALVRLLGLPTASSFTAQRTGLRTYRARHQLAVVCRALGRPREAERLWKQAVSENADWLPAWRGLVELYREEGRKDDLDGALAEIARRGGGLPGRYAGS